MARQATQVRHEDALNQPGGQAGAANLGGYLKIAHRTDDPSAPENPGMVAFNKGVIWGQAGDDEKALAAFHEAAELSPEFAEAHYNIGIALQNTGKTHPSSVYPHFKQAIRINQALYLAHYNLGYSFLTHGHFHDADLTLRGAVKWQIWDLEKYTVPQLRKAKPRDPGKRRLIAACAEELEAKIGKTKEELRSIPKEWIAPKDAGLAAIELFRSLEAVFDGIAARLRDYERENSGLVSPETVHDNNPVLWEPTTPAGAAAQPRPRSALQMPKAGHEVTRHKTSVAAHFGLDVEELNLSAMAAAASNEVAVRAATADPEELQELRDIRRLWNLRLDLHQKSKVAATFPETLNEAQYRFAKSLDKTANEIRSLEADLLGPDQVSEKTEIVSEIKRRASAYEYEPKRVRPRRQRSRDAEPLRKING